MASAKNIGNLYAELSVRDKMTLGLNKAKKSLNAFAKKSAGLALSGSKYAAAGVAVTGAALVAGTKGAISMVDAIGDMSAQTGVGVAALMKLQQAYKDGGGEAEDAGKDIAKMQKTIANSKMDGSDPFTSMGISLESLMAMSPDEQFKTIGDAIMRIENPTLRNAKAMEIFGKSGTKLISVFGSLETSATKLGNMPALAAKFAAAMDEANDIFGRLNTKKDQFFVGFASGIIGELLPNLQKVDGYDFTELGNNLGKNLAIGFRGLMDGTFLDIAGFKMLGWIVDVSNDIASGIGAAMKTAYDYGSNLFMGLGGKISGGLLRGIADATGNEELGKAADNAWNLGKEQDIGKMFKENFAQNQAVGDQSNLWYKMADDSWNRLIQTHEEGLEKAAAIGEKAKDDEDIKSPTAKIEEAKSTAESIKSEVNSMQARGLGMGRENVASKVDEQIENLKQIVKLLTEQNKMKLSAVF